MLRLVAPLRRTLEGHAHALTGREGCDAVSGSTDGPFVEAKEVVGGFMIVSAESYDRAVEVVRACPAVHAPGALLEIRELAGAKM